MGRVNVHVKGESLLLPDGFSHARKHSLRHRTLRDSAGPARMEFFLSVFFLFLYYIRPQDWIGALQGFNIMRPLILFWIIALASGRNRSPLPGVMCTPHDWVMLVYLLYVSWTAPDQKGTFMGFLPLVVFYALTVQSLSSWDRVLSYLKAWNWMLCGVALIAMASLYGIDITNAALATKVMFGRLCLGTWLHNNPNALGHSIIVILPLSYFLYFWRGGFNGRMVLFPAMCTLAYVCAVQTESKGSYLVAGGLVVLIFIIGRPLPVKLLAVAFAMTAGVSALSFLPRMSKMGDLRSDEGVQGRLMVWEMAKGELEKTGYGWKQFVAFIQWEGETILKATHSSYVQIGAELGIYGLSIFLAGIWVSFRSLATSYRFTSVEDDWERCRRAGLILILSYTASSWMINREYHTEYFLMIAVAAAIHRLCVSSQSTTENTVSNEPTPGTKIWNRFGPIDIAASALMTWSVLQIWDYILKNL